MYIFLFFFGRTLRFSQTLYLEKVATVSMRTYR
jgi:hypothetical protein